MTADLMIDPADTGEVVDLTATERLTVGEDTRALRPYEADTTPLLRLEVTDEHPTLTVPRTFEVVADYTPKPSGPAIPPKPTPPPRPRHALTERVGEYPVVRPAVPPAGQRLPRGRHRAGHSVAYGVLTGVGATLFTLAVLALAALVVLR